MLGGCGGWQACDKHDYTPPMQQPLRVDTSGVQPMAIRWGALASELNVTAAPAGSGLSCQASTASVSAARADITVFTAALAARVGACATHVAEADAPYIANETRSANMLAAAAHPALGV